MKQVGIWIGVIVVIIVAVVGLIALSNANSNPPLPSLTDASNLPPVTSSDMQEGPANAKVTMIEYADFQCPACDQEYPILKQLTQDYKTKLHFVYRYFPLTQAHHNAMIAAQYAYASYLQGKFWQMHDLMYEHQNDWAELSNQDAAKVFDGYAKQLGMNLDQLHKDINDKKTIAFIQNDINGGNQAGVNATPTLYLNGKQIVITDHLPTYDELKQLVDKQLNQK